MRPAKLLVFRVDEDAIVLDLSVVVVFGEVVADQKENARIEAIGETMSSRYYKVIAQQTAATICVIVFVEVFHFVRRNFHVKLEKKRKQSHSRFS